MAGDEGAERLRYSATPSSSWAEMQFQLSVTDTAELRDAQLHPENLQGFDGENHRLQRRIRGYVPFAQNEIIRRDELS